MAVHDPLATHKAVISSPHWRCPGTGLGTAGLQSLDDATGLSARITD